MAGLYEIILRGKIVNKSSIPEPTNEHHKASLSKKHPGAGNPAPQGRAIKLAPRSQ